MKKTKAKTGVCPLAVLHTLGFWRSTTGKVSIVCIVQMSDCRRKSSVSLSPWTSLRSAAPGNTVDYGLFWITSVGLLPRQQQLEKTRLPSRVGFCSNQGHEKKKKNGGLQWHILHLCRNHVHLLMCGTFADASSSRASQRLRPSWLHSLRLWETWKCRNNISNW